MKKQLSLAYSLIQGSNTLIYSGFGTFVSVYLLAQGFKNSEIGLCISLANLLAALTQPWLADFADRSKRYKLSHILGFLGLGLLALLLGLLFLKGTTLWLIGAYLLLFTIHGLIQPLVNAMYPLFRRLGYDINFGLCRSVGSLSYSIGTALIGPLLIIFGPPFIIWVSLLGAVLFLAAVLASHFLLKKIDRPAVASEEKVEKEVISLGQFIRNNKNFMIMNLGIMLLWYHASAVAAFMFQFVQPIGGTEADVGLLFSIGAVLEIPPLILYNSFEKKFGVENILIFSVIGFVLKYTLFCMAQQMWLVYVSQILQMIAYAIFFPAIVSYIGKVMKESEAVKGQALFVMMTMIAGIISNISGGFILDYLGVNTLYWVGLVTCYVGAGLIIFMVKKIQRGVN